MLHYCGFTSMYRALSYPYRSLAGYPMSAHMKIKHKLQIPRKCRPNFFIKTFSFKFAKFMTQYLNYLLICLDFIVVRLEINTHTHPPTHPTHTHQHTPHTHTLLNKTLHINKHKLGNWDYINIVLVTYLIYNSLCHSVRLSVRLTVHQSVTP